MKPVLAIGRPTVTNSLGTEHPSMTAASKSSLGMLSKKPDMIYIVIGSENAVYGIIRPTSESVRCQDANWVYNEKSTQWMGIIIPIMKYVSISFEYFQRSFAIENAAIEPTISEMISVTVDTMNELSVALPRRPLVHAKMKLSAKDEKSEGKAQGLLLKSALGFIADMIIHKSGRI